MYDPIDLSLTKHASARAMAGFLRKALLTAALEDVSPTGRVVHPFKVDGSPDMLKLKRGTTVLYQGHAIHCTLYYELGDVKLDYLGWTNRHFYTRDDGRTVSITHENQIIHVHLNDGDEVQTFDFNQDFFGDREFDLIPVGSPIHEYAARLWWVLHNQTVVTGMAGI